MSYALIGDIGRVVYIIPSYQVAASHFGILDHLGCNSASGRISPSLDRLLDLAVLNTTLLSLSAAHT